MKIEVYGGISWQVQKHLDESLEKANLSICKPEDHEWEIYQTDIDWFWTYEKGSKDFVVYKVRCPKCRTRATAMPSNKQELEAVRQKVDVTVPLSDNRQVKLDRGWSETKAHLESLKVKQGVGEPAS